ncbi:general stress protein [Aquisalibacillus elongatus]|uniref:Heat induced stress protein YflT n=1 Tax=Aquisalibacillus elongatus TaxID=485577 RepID=A0A3N5B0B8_9BACI|nr:general stress protein [Aquisalibacillus elongatus]RPF50609.1 heat induced stress protein YflT [Aquisalibacillus elongatus]
MFVKDYKTDQNLEQDVQKLMKAGINEQDIYVLAHDDEHTQDLVEDTQANSINLSQSNFKQKGDELRAKLEDVGVSESSAEQYEAMLDEGKILLIVKGQHDIESILQQ